MNLDRIARIAHEINRAYCASLGDASQPAWEDAPEWQRQSAIAGVMMHQGNPDATPEDSHVSWLAQKEADGWKYGPAKDSEKKEHPCFMPYAELPQEQKAKDFLFRAVVHLMSGIVERESGNAVAKPVSGLVGVKYIGRSELWEDPIYQSGLYFLEGQVRYLAPVLAEKLLRHPDIFERADAAAAPEAASAYAAEDDTAELLEKSESKKSEEIDELARMLDIKQQVGLMDKDALKHFALLNFRQKLDGREAVESLRAKVGGLIDQFGVV